MDTRVSHRTVGERVAVMLCLTLAVIWPFVAVYYFKSVRGPASTDPSLAEHMGSVAQPFREGFSYLYLIAAPALIAGCWLCRRRLGVLVAAVGAVTAASTAAYFGLGIQHCSWANWGDSGLRSRDGLLDLAQLSAFVAAAFVGGLFLGRTADARVRTVIGLSLALSATAMVLLDAHGGSCAGVSVVVVREFFALMLGIVAIPCALLFSGAGFAIARRRNIRAVIVS